MLDLVILLSISFAVTALLGLLLVGFVWVPWLIGLGLLVLLLALMKITASSDSSSPELAHEWETATPLSPLDQKLGQKAQDPQAARNLKPVAAFSDTVVSPAMPVMVYRGVKYKTTSASSSAGSPTVSEGKYRGQLWSRSR